MSHSRKNWAKRGLWVFALTVLLSCPADELWALNDREKKAVENFGRLHESSALMWDSMTIRQFCAIKDEFVVKAVIDTYYRGRKDHPAQLRALLITELGKRGIQNDSEREQIKDFLKKVMKRGEHSWAVHQAATMLLKYGKDDQLVKDLFLKDKKLWRRIAALEAFGRSGKHHWLKEASSWFDAIMKVKGEDRDVLLTSLAWSVARVAHKPPEKPKPVKPSPVKPKVNPATPKKPAPKAPPKLPEPGPEKADPKDPAGPAKPTEPTKTPAPKPTKPQATPKPGTPKPGAPKPPAKPAVKAPAKPKPVKVKTKAERVRKVAKAVLDQLIDTMDHRKVDRRAKAKIAKALRFAFGGKQAPINSQYWKPYLIGKSGVAQPTTVERGARFMSIDADGDRLLFLLDASDSMLKPLTAEERAAFRKLFPPSEKKSVERAWAGVKTRFDAARVHIIATVKKLDRRQFVSIIWFGDQAKVCPATPGFVKASKKNKRRVIQAIQDFNPKPATQMKPLGILLGQTNYYSSLHKSFLHSIKGPVKTENPEIHRALIRQGADMIFLLSDGTPNSDGFRGQSPEMEYERTIYKHVKTGEREVTGDYYDPETGVKVKGKKRMVPIYKSIPIKKVKEKRRQYYSQGPYIQDASFLDEVERLNLLRKITIHTISFGETRKTLLQKVAEHGYGEFVDVTGGD